MASGSQTKTQGIVEVTWGVTPTGTPTFLQLPVTSNTLQLTKGALVDNTLRSDRNGGDVRPGAKKVGGDLKWNHRYGDFDNLLANLMQAAWATDVLKNGKTVSSMSIETGYLDAVQYAVISGLQANTMSLSIKPNSLIDVSMTFIGKDQTAMSGTSAASTSTEPTGSEPFDSFTGSLSEGGATSAIVTGLDLNVNNNLTGNEVIFSNVINGISAGNCIIDGTLTCQFLNATMYNKFVNNTESELEFTLTDPDGNSHTFALPKIMYTSGGISPTGPEDLILSMQFNAQYDSTLGAKMSVTRDAA